MELSKMGSSNMGLSNMEKFEQKLLRSIEPHVLASTTLLGYYSRKR